MAAANRLRRGEAHNVRLAVLNEWESVSLILPPFP